MSDLNGEKERVEIASSFVKRKRSLALAGFLVGYLVAFTSVMAFVDPERIAVMLNSILNDRGIFIVLASAGFALMLISTTFYVRSKKEARRFEQVDDSAENKAREGAEVNRETEVASLDKISEQEPKVHADIGEMLADGYVAYHRSMVASLERKASIADRKASILLDTGTAYAKGGMAFMAISIIVWQTVSIIFGFSEQIIYGMASCSLLFVFIEVLSAWFLKQYKSFVDASSYLMKIKSIFDRYMLTYFAVQEYSEIEYQEKKEIVDRMFVALGEEIKWPDNKVGRSAEMSFVSEAIDTMTQMMKIVKSSKN